MKEFDLAGFEEEARVAQENDIASSALMGVDPERETEASPPAEEDAPPPEKTAEEPPAWAQELREAAERAERQAIAARYQQQQQPDPQQVAYQQWLQQQQQAQQAQRQPTRWATDLDLDEYGRKLQHLEQTAQKFAAVAQNQEQLSFRAAEAQLKTRFPDFDEFVTPEQRQQALQHALKSESFGNDWAQRMELAYKVAAFDKVAKRNDEVAAQREKKRAGDVRTAAQVPPSGSNYQAPQPKLDTHKRGYKDAQSGFMTEWRSAL